MYDITKACLLFIKKIRIDWRMTEELFNDAFPNVKSKTVRRGDLEKLFYLFIGSTSEQEFLHTVQSLNIKDALEYDTFLGGGMTDPEKIKRFISYLSIAYERNSIQPYLYKGKKAPDSAKDFFHDMYCEMIEDGRVFILKALLMRRGDENWGGSPLDGYNHSLELMLSGMAHHLFKKAYESGNYKRNDMIDLYHLAYVDRKKKILTREKIIRDYVAKYQPYSLVEIDA